MIAALLFAIPMVDQWSPIFDHGDRWPTCSITYSGLHTKPVVRAAKEIQKATGIQLTYVSVNGQIVVRKSKEVRSDRLAEGLSTVTPGTNVYESGFINGYGGLNTFPKTYRRAVWKHEFAHVLGLGHSDNPYDLMYAAGPGINTSNEWKVLLKNLYPECSLIPT